MAKKAKKETFEEALGRLEEIAEQLETGQMPLDKAVKRYEEGVRAYMYCSSLLKHVERKIELLTQEGDTLKAEEAPDFDPVE